MLRNTVEELRDTIRVPRRPFQEDSGRGCEGFILQRGFKLGANADRAFCLAISGCFDPPPQKVDGKGPTPSLAAEKPTVSNDNKPPLFDWKKPAAAFLLTGEQHGYFEPCGCSLHQLGGMARRGDLVRMLAKDRKWPLSGLDVGGTLNEVADRIKSSSC